MFIEKDIIEEFCKDQHVVVQYAWIGCLKTCLKTESILRAFEEENNKFTLKNFSKMSLDEQRKNFEGFLFWFNEKLWGNNGRQNNDDCPPPIGCTK